MIAKKIYAALHKEFPELSNNQIADIIGVGHSGVSKLAKGYGLGLIAAQWLADNREGYDKLNADAITNHAKVRRIAEAKRQAIRNKVKCKCKKVRLADLSAHVRGMIGYVG